ncbi:MAG: tRNA (adenosine(37)-N6)-threonylcarbamoyltransferase complex transferase subunit TsaD [Parcubacteria group bacterium CG1_02_37_51]|uniref:tRNA N6-adenosine threonylcarbamoyltransferase n=2 Tax=Candidatus Komeiliibacteriota TaxID=1817908 RepID=A0A2M8DQH2_9BACT|nr:MAG: tRNA (adenosine(37)-N6)-threonylcarbamoyltransferase complex transferase subunit TsaD [Parcubacteria group bacterium CG1_02_37_51]PIY95223.1 MAG: tRNA (adenosine(37)-N6)-threonylcarbamoyltransferase complex transferase subunit TsaD [Candidatus Komeilibacteria bacterium CG_4_10_14_0_8_um_filter_37_78]PJC01378.1 MAG: tRNA (adenosine(37)-N6)-threonylcarbamoyltransferase complex transferase subunit TsaD [Candidatus Komeilibacteria bacterium CG_4_9_14_0_8_um_filter_36_9]
MRILAIESSCDETAASLVKIDQKGIEVERNIVSSQVNIHAKYGGVVPEVAARMHAETIIPVLQECFGRKYKAEDVDAIAVTYGPGLITSLLVGLETAKTLAYVWQKPIIGVNHLEGHLYSSWLESEELTVNSKEIFPAIVLIVSGGHTELILMTDYGQYKTIGKTRDDAAGEAFDKVAKIMNIGYPGGPIISERAAEGKPDAIDFPRPMLNSKSLDFSFSGLKTAVRYYVDGRKLKEREINNIAASFQEAAVDVLREKAMLAIAKYQAKSLIIGGGVAANKKLRKELLIATDRAGIQFYCPRMKYAGDNAAMIALAGYYHLQGYSKEKLAEQINNWKILQPDANLEL